MNNSPIYIIGHSLGAARALLHAWSRIKRGLRVNGVYAFAPPNPGDKQIGIGLTPVPIKASLRNGRDLVTDVPIDLEFLNEQYEQPLPFIELSEPPDPLDPWGPFLKYHHIHLYQAGAYKLPTIGVALEIGEAVDWVERLYRSSGGWDWINPVDGSYCAMKILSNGTRVAIHRGSITEKDWLDDFDALQVEVMGARVSEGFWRGVATIQNKIDAQLDV